MQFIVQGSSCSSIPSAVGDGLPFLDQRMQQMAKVAELGLGGEVRRVRQLGQRRDAVDRRIENQLRPLRRTRILQSLRPSILKR